MCVYVHFEYDGEKGWEVLGCGEGSGEDLLPSAVQDLRMLYGGELPAGGYRWIEAQRDDPQWQTFELDDRGQIVQDRRAVLRRPLA